MANLGVSYTLFAASNDVSEVHYDPTRADEGYLVFSDWVSDVRTDGSSVVKDTSRR